MSCKPRHMNKFLSLIAIAAGGTASFGAICIHRGDEKFYSNALMPFTARFVDPETAHNMCILLTKYGLIRCRDDLQPDRAKKLETNVFNMKFANPIGVAAGFDKNSQAIGGLVHYGLGFAEVGTVTPRPQAGNAKKRIFRIRDDNALINRCGFNNKGIDFVVDTLSRTPSFKPLMVGLNLGKNKDTEHISSDYILGLEKSKDLKSIDYYVINISSPNTPGLRNSQDRKNLDALLTDVLDFIDKSQIKKPLLIKVAPDLSDAQIKDIADVVKSKRSGNVKVDGIILTNTTIARPPVSGMSDDKIYEESGGLSGQPLRDTSTKVIKKFYEYTGGRIPIIGVGGVSSGQDAYDKLKAGASLIQLYTSLTYEGPPVVNKIKRELVELLERDNMRSVEDVVGLDHRTNRKTKK